MRKNVQTGIKLFCSFFCWSYLELCLQRKFKGFNNINHNLFCRNITGKFFFLKCFLGSLACSSKTGKLLSPEGVVQFTKYSSNMVRYVFKYVITIFYKTHNLTTNLNSLFNTIRQLSYNINNNLYIFMLH